MRLGGLLCLCLALESGAQFLIGIPIGGGNGGGGGGKSSSSRPSETPCRPLAIPNAVYSPPIAGTANISSGGRVMISCKTNFENVGAEWVVCGADGMWKTAAWAKDAPPSCQASCQPLELSNATFTPSEAGSSTSKNGAQVMVTCDEGFEYQGSNPVTCSEGSWSGLGQCFDSSNSFCRDENLVPLISGLLQTYSEDPLKATKAINRYVLGFRGIRANGLGYIGLNPSPAFQPFETNAYYVPGITGSDATYTSVVLLNSWNMTALPDHFKLENVFCRVVSDEATAYVLKVLYKESFGFFSFGNK